MARILKTTRVRWWKRVLSPEGKLSLHTKVDRLIGMYNVGLVLK